MSNFLSLKQKEELIKGYNKLAMEQLQQENYDSSLSYLKQALLGIKGISDEKLKKKSMAVTYNNLGIFFKRTSNFPEALKYLYKSIELENKIPHEIPTVSGAHLNICSILASQGDHSQAIRHGLRALFLLKSVYKFQPMLVPTLVTAYYNVARQYKILGQSSDADDCYKVGYKICIEELGPQHSLTQSFCLALNQKNNLRKISPNFDLVRNLKKKSASPKTRTINSSVKGRSTSQESQKKMSYAASVKEAEPVNQIKPKNFYERKIVIKKPNKSKFDEEKSATTEKTNGSSNNWTKRIDLAKHKETEKVAAVLIQSAWRGYRARTLFKELQVGQKLRQAELTARRAVEEYEKLKQQAAKIRKK